MSEVTELPLPMHCSGVLPAHARDERHGVTLIIVFEYEKGTRIVGDADSINLWTSRPGLTLSAGWHVHMIVSCMERRPVRCSVYEHDKYIKHINPLTAMMETWHRAGPGYQMEL